jgi:dipeptidyl aminopeptidase/acylaminoacyl peptidase
VSGQCWISSWDWAAGTLAMAMATPTQFPELVTQRATFSETTVALNNGEEQTKLTDLTGPFSRRVEIVEPVSFVARSSDGTEIPCWAVAPVGAQEGRRYPTVLNVHGGPFTSYGNKFFDEFQLQAGGGIGVLYCNPRGSSGYSEAWGRAVRFPEARSDPGTGWGGIDFDDVMACVDEGARRFDWVDPQRLGIMGGSYGGYMTSWAIGHTDRFKAACSERAANNLLALEISSDIATGFRSYVGRSHLEDPAAYIRQSPITYARDIDTPLLILHSEDDLRCPINQAEELFVALRLMGKEPRFVRFPGEGHELSRSGAPRHRVARIELILEWFKEQLAVPG